MISSSVTLGSRYAGDRRALRCPAAVVSKKEDTRDASTRSLRHDGFRDDDEPAIEAEVRALLASTSPCVPTRAARTGVSARLFPRE